MECKFYEQCENAKECKLAQKDEFIVGKSVIIEEPKCFKKKKPDK